MKIIKNFVKSILYKTSKFYLIKIFFARYKNNSVIFCLHRVLPDNLRKKEKSKNLDFILTTDYFENFIIDIKKKFKFVELKTLINNKNPNKKICHLTFDDGYIDNLIYALPIIKKYKVPCTIYISDNYMNKNSRVKNFLCANNHNDFMSWNEVRTLIKSKLVTIGCHTTNHLELSKLNKKKIYEEIYFSKKNIEKNIGKKVVDFAYPYGGKKNFDENAISVLKKLKFTNAVTAICKKWDSQDSHFLIPRYFVTEECSRNILSSRINGLSNFFKNQLLP